MILAAADPGSTGPFLPYALGMALFFGGLAVFLLTCRAVHVTVARRIRRHVTRALDNGDARIADATAAMWTARNHPPMTSHLENQR